MQLNLPKSKVFKAYSLSETAISLEFGNEISPAVADNVRRFTSLIEQNPFKGMKALVPAYTTLTIFYDLVEVVQNPSLQGLDAYEKVLNYLAGLEEQLESILLIINNDTIKIPVCYEGEHAPDLEAVAAHTGVSSAEIISMHSSACYSVYMIGFTPGFAYLGGMPEQLATPRKQSPAKLVLPGSVGIAGKQTGIYPMSSPGGWQIIGRTPLKLFDPDRPSSPSLLKAGNTVRFEPISIAVFDTLKQHQ